MKVLENIGAQQNSNREKRFKCIDSKKGSDNVAHNNKCLNMYREALTFAPNPEQKEIELTEVICATLEQNRFFGQG